MKKLLVLLLIATQAWAGLPPPTIQGQSGTKLNAKFDHQVPFNQATDLGGTKALIETGNQNLLLDANFQGVYTANLAAGWTLSTATAVKDTTNFIDGNVSQQVSVTAQTGELSQDVTPTIQTNGVPMVSACMVKTTGTDVQVCARTNATDIQCNTVASNGNWVLQPVNFTGPANGTSVGVSVKNTASSTETYNVGKCYVGVSSTPQNFGQVSQAVFEGDIKITGCAGAWTTSTTGSYSDFSAQTGCSYSVSGKLSAPSTMLPGFSLTDGPGNYLFIVGGKFAQDNANNGTAYFTFTDGTNYSKEENEAGNGASQAILVPPGAFHIQETNSFSATNFRIQAKTSSVSALADVAGTASQPLTISVWKFPTASEIAYRPDVLPASYSGTQAGTGGGWTTTSTGAYGDFTVATTSSTLTQLTAQNMSCVAESTKLPAITCTFPRAGLYPVCASLTAGNNSTGDRIEVEMVDGSGNIINGGLAGISPSANQFAPFTLCGAVNVPNTSAVTMKIKGEVTGGSTGNITQSALTPITWLVGVAAQGMSAPLLMGSVTSTSTGQFHVESADLSSTCVTANQSSAWYTATHPGTGTCTLTFSAGVFSSQPICVVSGRTSGVGYCNLSGAGLSSTAVTTSCVASGTSTDIPQTVFCMGPR